jgi:hypothetical protein
MLQYASTTSSKANHLKLRLNGFNGRKYIHIHTFVQNENNKRGHVELIDYTQAHALQSSTSSPKPRKSSREVSIKRSTYLAIFLDEADLAGEMLQPEILGTATH